MTLFGLATYGRPSSRRHEGCHTLNEDRTGIPANTTLVIDGEPDWIGRLRFADEFPERGVPMTASLLSMSSFIVNCCVAGPPR